MTLLKETLYVRLFGLMKIPMIWWLRPRVIKLDSEQTQIVLPLSRRAKNHLNSMYFGALSAGADLAGGLSAMREIEKSGKKIALSFKTFHAEFKKRAEGDVLFECNQGAEIREFVQKVAESHERHEMMVHIKATCPRLSDEVVAEFRLELSLKAKQDSRSR